MQEGALPFISFLGSLQLIFLIPSFWSDARAGQWGVPILLKLDTRLGLYDVADP